MGKMESQKFTPTVEEWSALRKLWERSKNVLASTLAPSAHARAAWTARTFSEENPKHKLNYVLAWVQSNLEISCSSSPELPVAVLDILEVQEDAVDIDVDDVAGWHDAPTTPGYRGLSPKDLEAACPR